MNIDSVIAVVTVFITYIFGTLAKKFNWIKAKYIPIQNVVIGIVAGVVVYFTGLSDSIVSAILICEVSALGAGGTYDALKKGCDSSHEVE